MRLTTIGTGTAAPSPARVCSGHLVEAGSVRLLLDCGSGVVHRMAALGMDWMGITHIAITHFHADHISDIAPLIFAWRYGHLPFRAAPVEILGPLGTLSVVDRLAAAFGSWVREPGFPVIVREMEAGTELELEDSVRIGSHKVPHTDESIAYSVEQHGRRVVYTGDTGYDAAFADWATACDVLLAECSLPLSMAIDTHLTPEQCGELAGLIAPDLLTLTHFYPPVELVDIRRAVAERFSGAVTLAHDGWSVGVG